MILRRISSTRNILLIYHIFTINSNDKYFLLVDLTIEYKYTTTFMPINCFSYFADSEVGKRMTKHDLINKIIALEWKMFHEVPNVGGPAACQNNPQTFEIMRRSQALSWSEKTLASYWQDLVEAEKKERNLMTEKYARMMASTFPEEYIEIRHHLPPLDPEVPELIEKIIKIILVWERELAKQYPYVCQRRRPIYSSEDNEYVTSLETYLRGELATFSLRTLKLYLEDLLQYSRENKNMSKIILEETVKNYGYNSLEEANKKIKSVIQKQLGD